MPNESGDLKLLANFRKLIDLVCGYRLQTFKRGAQADSARSAARCRHGRSA
ncbi:MAG TPA: hypothetical protein VHQ64_17690 [Pyrinomonadaceae bacterium]|jgi:hypothetical protein|nr:hypothetical protein [Pyrinomonadaceae bacterium]